MKYIAAYLLSVAAGNAKPTQEQVKKILEAAGVEVDAAQLEQVITKMNEKSVEELVETGKNEMGKVGGAAPAHAGSAPAAAAAEAPKEEAKEEEVVQLGVGDMFDF
ncbi:60s Acidic ribosomal protein [Trichomonas vaginalis G3]|uniref:60s Acidic ribosomal protein n=1 Tax=Trichomonas vaginalis (strain ATCC PRA-98 / G3) TaxID=412133 RepID=A2E256_TRIV3|nr:translational elongation [Trichomonas vaginalis G3]EAY13270.1 60s Acidic ribosomal protein [Trichomonas vaginalis G3]KAI5494074.1 translational elongation [Trichomonas vaginalis G3]|eukprot:XP_001325493.1 60s Acidic ribosomal protein [Trichomonas vaginalis G3]